MRKFLLLLALFIGGCASFEERPLKVGTDTRYIILIRAYDTREECSRLSTSPPGWRPIACATLRPTDCTIRMQPDATDDTLGHEVRHCFDGDWHRNLGRKPA